jgi:hypothetical protein
LAFLSPIPISFSKSSTLALLMSIFLLAIITANHLYILKLTKNINFSFNIVNVMVTFRFIYGLQMPKIMMHLCSATPLVITPEQKRRQSPKYNLASLLWHLTLCINLK